MSEFMGLIYGHYEAKVGRVTFPFYEVSGKYFSSNYDDVNSNLKQIVALKLLQISMKKIFGSNEALVNVFHAT